MRKLQHSLIAIILLLSLLMSGCGVEQNEVVSTPCPTVYVSPSPSPSPKITYQCFVTATGSCYHNHKCGNMNMNKVTYMTVEEAKQAGYKACSKCY